MNDLKSSRIIIAVAFALAIAGCSRNDPDKFIASAETYLAKSDYRAAIIELKNALSLNPDNARARFLLGKASLDGGDHIGAMTELRKAIALGYSADEAYPLLARALVLRGAPKNEILELAKAPVQSAHAKAEIGATIAIGYLSLGEMRDARAEIDAALAVEPSNVAVRIAQARLKAVEGDLTGALQQVDAVLAAAPNNLEALTFKGELEQTMGKHADAIRTLESVLVVQPSMFYARYLLASSFVQTHELDKATAQVDAMKKLAAADPRTLFAVALVAFARGDTTAALEAVQKSLAAAPDFRPSLYLSGLVDLKRGAYASAEQSMRAVVAKSNNDDRARIALAEILLRSGQPGKAQETLDVALHRAPNDIAALRVAAEIQLALKNSDKAADFLQRANALDKDNLSGQVRAAQVRLAKGDTAQGVRDLEALSAANPEKLEADLALITAHVRAHDYDKAVAAAEALVKKLPKSPAAHNAKGGVYLAKGDLKNARQSFEKALTLDPAYSSSIYGLARIDQAERNFASARQRYERLLASDPKSERVLLGLADLLLVSNAPAQEVAAAFQRAVDANPQSLGSRLAQINYLGSRKDWKAASTAAQAADAAIPDSPGVLEAMAAIQQVMGEQNQALETYARLGKLQPDNPLPLIRSAGIYASLKNYDAAIASLSRARALAPDNPTVWIGSAAAYAQANKFDAGLAEARKMQKELPNRSGGFALEAELLATRNQLAEAVTAYRAALTRNAPPSVALRLHAVLLAMGKPNEAATLTANWLKEHPKDVAMRAYLAQQSLAQRDYKTAVPLLRAALEIEPENPALLNDLAWSLSELKDAKALEYAERAYRIAPNSAAIANTYGWVLVQRGDTARGIEYLRRAVDLEPADTDKRLYLAKALIMSGDKPGARKELEIIAKADSAPARTEAEQLLKDL